MRTKGRTLRGTLIILGGGRTLAMKESMKVAVVVCMKRGARAGHETGK